MKFLIFIYVLFQAIAVKGQNSYDTLSKYSYLVVGVKDTVINNYNKSIKWREGTATGFFIKRNDTVFFVTARHVFEAYRYGWEQLEIRFYDDSAKDVGYFSINIRNFPQDHLHKYPDVYAYPTSLKSISKNIRIHSIENLVNPSQFVTNEDTNKIFFYGFHLPPKEIDTSSYLIDTLTSDLYFGNIKRANNKLLKGYENIDSLNIVCSPHTEHGSSGAPVFIRRTKVVKGIKKEYYEFAGIVSLSDSVHNNTAIIKPKYVIQAMSDYKKMIYQLKN